jgi:hypothetical protein
MAIVKFNRTLLRNGNNAAGLGYGQIEPNQVWFNRAGMVEAQCALDTNCFSDVQVNPLTAYAAAAGTTPATKIVAQNGAFLMVDKANYTATIPTKAGAITNGYPVGINYSSEYLPDERAKGRRNFYLTTNDWLPRIGYVERGMRITTNTVQWDTTATAVDLSGFATTADSYGMWNAVRTFINSNPTTPLYAAVRDGSDGELIIGVTPDSDEDIILAQVVAAYDNADRTCSFMFQILDGGTK